MPSFSLCLGGHPNEPVALLLHPERQDSCVRNSLLPASIMLFLLLRTVPERHDSAAPLCSLISSVVVEIHLRGPLNRSIRFMGNCWGTKISSDSTAFPSGTNSRYASMNGAALSSSRSYASVASVPRNEGEILESANVKAFTFNELRTATRNFRPDSVLGEGGFGSVFKGWIDEKTPHTD